MNLTHLYFNGDWSWIDHYVSVMGKSEFDRYVNRVYIRLNKMKIGDEFDIVKDVIPQNFDLFIKVTEWFMIDVNKGYNDKWYKFNEEYTVIKCTRIWEYQKKNIGVKNK